MAFARGGLTGRFLTLVERSPIQTAEKITSVKTARIAGLRQNGVDAGSTAGCAASATDEMEGDDGAC